MIFLNNACCVWSSNDGCNYKNYHLIKFHFNNFALESPFLPHRKCNYNRIKHIETYQNYKDVFLDLVDKKQKNKCWQVDQDSVTNEGGA